MKSSIPGAVTWTPGDPSLKDGDWNITQSHSMGEDYLMSPHHEYERGITIIFASLIIISLVICYIFRKHY